MWSVCFAFLAAFAATFEYVNAGKAPKVRIDVYYETDCPDSMKFITRQLYPFYNELKEILDIHLYPYGKAQCLDGNGGWKALPTTQTYVCGPREIKRSFDKKKNMNTFSCQHGESECYGNSYQACVLKCSKLFKDAMVIVDCMERSPKPSENGRKCAEERGFDLEKVEKCANGTMGNRFMNEIADKTESLKPKLFFVPWIVFDNVYDERDFRTAIKNNLKGVVCRRYKGHHPKCG